MSGPFRVAVSAGTRRSTDPAAWPRPHAWTEDGVAIEAELNGAHRYLLTVATCVLNDPYREAGETRSDLDRVEAEASFDDAWACTGVDYAVDLDTSAPEEQVAALLTRVDDVAEMPRALRRGAEVRRVDR